MTLPERLFANHEAVRHITRQGIEGAIVECGVWRGGSTMAMLHTLLDAQDTSRDIYLFDTFEGMSAPGREDKVWFGDHAADMLDSSDKHYPRSVWCYASLEDVQKNVWSTGYLGARFHFVKGKVENTNQGTITNKIKIR